MQNLTAPEIALALKDHKGWTLNDHGLEKEFTFADFSLALGFMVRIGLIAEKMNHHPELRNVYNRLYIRLTTHQSGGVTPLDVALAQAIDQLK